MKNITKHEAVPGRECGLMNISHSFCHTGFKGLMILILATLMIAFTTTGLRAQWSHNTAVNIQISSLPTADLECAPTSDAKTWVAFYHQNGGNYDMRAQLFDANGYKLLGTDGVLVSSYPTGSSTSVFNVCVDASNNLIVGCQDQRSGPMSAYVFKISQTGTQLWGSTGILLGQGLSPYPAVLSNGEVVVAWNDGVSNTLSLQKITTSGTTAWGTPISVLVGSTGTTRGQPIGNTAGKFTMVYQKKGTGISTTLYAQMWDNSGTALYSATQIGSLTTSGARYYSIKADGDTTYFGYYASSGSRFNSYLQRINPGGTIPYGMNGSSFNTSVSGSDPNQMETFINITPGSSWVWAMCTFSNPSQTQYGVYVQKFLKSSGGRQFTDGAKVIYAISSSSDQMCGTLALVSDAPMFESYDGVDKIYASRLDASGNFVWPGNRVEISSTTAGGSTPKMRFGFTPDGPNRCAGFWTENRGSNYLGYAQGISIGGLVGIVVKTQGNVPALITTPGGTLQCVDTIWPSTASQSVTWSIIPGTGQASINTSGLVTAIANGTVYAKAVAVQDVTMKDSLLITISNQAPQAPSVTTLAASNILTTSAQLNGTVNANGASTTVTFQWGTTISYGNTVGATPGTVTGSTPTSVLANISGLTNGTTYHYRCVGVNSVGTTNGNDMTFVAGCNPVGPAGSITGPTDVCNNATGKIYSITAVQYATGYNWTVPTGATITAGQNTTSITVTFGTTSGNITVTPTNICSSGTASTLAVSVNAPPVPTLTGQTTACQGGGAVTYTTDAGMSNYTWTVTAGGTIAAGAGTYQIQVNWTGTGAQNVTVNYTGLSGCMGVNPTSLGVMVNPIPDAAGGITGTPVVCAGTSGVAYSVPAINNATTYMWTLPSGATIASGNNTNNVTVDYSASAVSGNITVTGNNTCGNGQASPPYPVTVNPIPSTPTITYANFILTSSAPAGNQWYFSATQGGTPTPIPGATAQTYVPTQIGYYTVIVTLNGCSSASSAPYHIDYIGIEEINPGNITITPVPCNGRFTITFSGADQNIYTVKIYSQLGAQVFASGSISVNGNYEKVIDIRPAADGVYSVVISSGGRSIVKKLVVRN